MGGKVKFSPHVVRHLLILALCRFAEPVALTSVSPYLYYMIKNFGVPTEDIAFYVGTIFGCFPLCQFFTGILWGRASDRFGRKPTILLGLSGTLVSVLMFGFSTSVHMAIFARCFSGLVNGNVGILRTMVAELVPQKELQPKAFSVMPVIWSLGCILGPIIGGSLSDPITNHPSWFKGDPPEIFKKFPFVLPNLVNASLLFCGISTGFLFLEETLRTTKHIPDPGRRIGRRIEKFFTSKSSRRKDITDETSPLLHSDFSPAADEEASSTPPPASGTEEPPPLREAFTFQSSVNIVVYCMLALHSVTFDQLLPVLMSYPRKDPDPEGGLLKFSGGFGMPSSRIGFLFSLYGITGMALQVFIFPLVANKLGILRFLRVVGAMMPIIYFVVPFGLLLPSDKHEAILFLLLVFKSLASTPAFPCSTILLTNSSPSLRLLGTLNGIAVAFAALARAIGPAVGGLAFSWGESTGYGIIPWCLLSVTAILAFIPMMWLEEGEGFRN